MNYDLVTDEYGQKLAIMFDYDPAKVSAIKSLPWEDTHRRWDGEKWTIDWNERSITLFEQALRVNVPAEYKPEIDNSGDVKLFVPEGSNQFYVRNPQHDVDDLLDRAFSYDNPAADWSPAVPRRIHIYNTGTHSAPAGLLDRARVLLDENGYDIEVEWEGRNFGSTISTEWSFEHELRGYQNDAISAVIDNRGGIVGLPTGTGKTITALRFINMIERRAIVTVHTQELLYQWADKVREVLGVEPGLVGDGNWSEGPVTIAIMQTLDSRGTSGLADDYGILIFDECHRTSAAETFHDIGQQIDAGWRVGLSATPWRSVSGEELKIEGAVGSVAHTVTAEEMIDAGYLARPRFETIDVPNARTAGRGEDYHEAMARVIEFDPVRNLAIARKAAELAEQGRKVLVNVNRISQAYIIGAALNASITEDDVAEFTDHGKIGMARQCYQQMGMSANRDARVVTSATGSDERKQTLRDFASGETHILVSTLVKEGVDIPDIDAIILAHGQKSDIETIQVIGRALRPQGADDALIIDVRDRGRFFGEAYKTRQNTMNEYYGSYGPSAHEDVQGTTRHEVRSLTDEAPTFEEIFDE